MRCPFVAAVSTFAFAAALGLAAVTALPVSGLAQQSVPLPPGGFKPPPAPPVKPYQTVAVTPPQPLNDPAFIAFRKQFADVTAKKDRAGLAKLVVAQNFFWLQDKDLADPHKSGIDNLAKAVDLDAKDGLGWETLAGYANEPSAAESPQQKGVFCAPADPTIDPKAFEALGKATGTDPSEWGYANKDGVEVHQTAKPNSPVIGKLGVYLVRVLPDSGQGADPNDPLFLHVAMPDGKTGFADAQLISPLGSDQICYAKDASGWKIAGYLGGTSQ
ncbi:MAG TPA: hypothetical protein VMA30_22510 [Xanthobacteraceae bacterium]|nr:hypothetical protein [Xanthobacteraceae bacterium]